MDASERLAYRPLRRADFAELAAWLADPEVERWWRTDYSMANLEAKYGPRIDGHDPPEVFVIEVDGIPAGIIQRYRTSDEPGWRGTLRQAVAEVADAPTAGIDYLLGRDDVRHRGIGTSVVRAFSQAVFDEMPDVTMIVVAVDQANRPSWRALERAGYRRVWAGVLASDDPSDAGPAYLLVLDRPALTVSVDRGHAGTSLT